MPASTQPGAERSATSRTAAEDGWLRGAAPESQPTSRPVEILTLAEAIKTAFARQPRLRVYLESLTQAERQKDVAFAPYLPTAAAGYSVGWADLRARVDDAKVGIGPVAVPLRYVSLDHDHTSFQMADLTMQWLICDFGRRYGRYRQAGIGIHIAEEQAARAYQTVANEVSVAYYEVLRARALVRTARDAVRRSQDDVDVARKLEQGGVVEKEKRLRVEVQLAQSLRALDETEGAEAIATAALNYAVGLNVNAATDIEEASDIPPFTKTLEEFLRTAVAQRHEFIVAQETIHLSDEGRRVAQADFAPRVFAAGTFANLDNQHPHGYGDALIGSINLQWTIFEGGRRVAELRIADSRIREAIAQAQSIADTIAYQVTVAYEQVTTSRAAIEHSRPAVDQAEENQRLVVARAKVGDATSSDITDAESTLTRAQQEYLNSIHDYLIALARLDYATGVTMAPRAVRAAGRSAAADEVGSRTIERSGTER